MSDDLFNWDSTPEITFANDPLAKAPYANCSNCPLLPFPCVPSYKPNGIIELIVVGEAPGWNEVQLNQPFVGQSGKLLDAVLDHIDIDTMQVYKTNACLCRPTDNKLDRYPGAVLACSERLRHELAQVSCDTIAAMGNKAMQALDILSNNTSTEGVLKRHGQWYALDEDRSYIAVYHPAFVLRSAGYMASLLTDMRSITIDRNPDKWLKIPYTVVNKHTLVQFSTALQYWLKHDFLSSFDTETPNLKDKRLLALGMTNSEDHCWIIPSNYYQQTPELITILDNFFVQAKTIAHNAKFDQQVLVKNGLQLFDVTHDTMLMHYSLDEQKGTHGLKSLLTSFVGVPDYESEFIDVHFRSIDRDKRDYSTIPEKDLFQYLAIDCCGTLALQRVLAAMIEADEMQQAYGIAMDASNALVRTELEGIKIDRPYLEKVRYHLLNAIGEAESNVQLDAREYTQHYIDTIPSTEWKQIARIDWIKSVDQYRIVLDKIANGSITNSGGKKRKLTGVNLASWQQMQILLYDVLGLKHVKKLSYKTDPRSTNAEALDALEDHPFVRILQEFRRLDKMRSTYVEPLLLMADSEDRVHINFNVHGTETGRLSANDGLHGIPRPSDKDVWGGAIRGSFIAKEGYKLISIDYSQAELRIFGALSGEPFILNAYNNDEDLHDNTCIEVFPDEPIIQAATYDPIKKKFYWTQEALDKLGVTIEYVEKFWKQRRTIAKNVNFGGWVYLGGPSGVAGMIRAQTGMDITEKQLKPIIDRRLASSPVAIQWQHQQFRTARDQGYVQSRFGNKRRFLLITDDNLDEVKKASVNAPIQNSASQLTVLSGIELTKRGFKVVHYNHDQLMIEEREELAEQTAKEAQEVMVNMGVKYFSEVKWKADIDIGDRWYQDRPNF